MRPQENNVWGTGSLRAWYKGEHHEAKIAREGACLPRKAGHAWYLQIPATLGTYGYLWVLTVPVIGYLWVLMGTHGTLIVYSPRTLRVPPGTQGYSAGTQGNSLRASCLEDESPTGCGAGASTSGTVAAKVHVRIFSNRPVPGFWVKYFFKF